MSPEHKQFPPVFRDLGETLHENIRWSFSLGSCVQKLAGACFMHYIGRDSSLII